MKVSDLDDAVELREAYHKAGELKNAVRSGPMTLFFMFCGDRYELKDIVDPGVVREAVMRACDQFRETKRGELAAIGVQIDPTE